ALKVNTKLIKYIGQTVMYCGFPENILPGIRNLCAQKNYGWHVHGETRIDIEGVATLDENYEGWVQDVLKRVLVVDVPGKNETKLSLETPVVEKYYDLVLWFLPKLTSFSKDQRDMLANRIGVLLLENLELLTEAVYSADQAEGLKAVDVRMEQLRYLVRIAKDMKYISIEKYDYFAAKTIEIRNMLITLNN